MEDVMRELLLFGLMLVAVLAVIGMMVGYSKFLDWKEARRATVKSSRMGGSDIMSRAPNDTPEKPPSSLQTDSRQTADKPMMPVPSRDVMFDTCKTLRKLGMAREEARAMLKALGLPLDNNLWAKAAPSTEEPPEVTPIGGRPYDPRLYQDPDLSYQPPPR